MSNGKEVKRWEIYNLCVLGEPMSAVVAGPFTDPKVRAVEVIAVEDHDRLVAERDELWKRATKFVMPGEMDTGESIEHYIKTLEQTIATQARVIEKYQQAVTRIWVSSDNCEHDMEPNTTMDFFRCEKCGIPSAFAAIEKEGAKDDAI